MNKISKILLSAVILLSASCGITTNNDISKEEIIQNANVKIAQEKTKQLEYQWKIDSLKSVNK